MKSHKSSDPQPLPLIRRLAIAAFLGIGLFYTVRAVAPDAVATSPASAADQLSSPIPAAEVPAFAQSADAVNPSPSVQLVTKNIEDIQPGDLVLARDEHGTEIGLRPVKEVYRRVSKHLRHLTFESSNGIRQTLSTTDEHPFWSVTANRFIDAGELAIGHKVTDPNGRTQVLITSTREEFAGGVSVFNSQVEDFHTYYVAAGNDNDVLLVHNANCGDLVDLWKAPAPSRPQSQVLDELENGFRQVNYPGNGPYFATDKSIAVAFQGHYGNGLQQIRIPREKYDELVAKGIIKADGYYPSGSVHVPSNLLDAFNKVATQGPANVLH